MVDYGFLCKVTPKNLNHQIFIHNCDNYSEVLLSGGA